MWKIIVVGVAALLSVASAEIPSSPQDLRITGLQVLRKSQIPVSDEPGKPAEPDDLFAAVRFRSAVDLAALAKNFFYQGLYAHFFRCRSGERMSEGTSLVFDRFGRISFGASASRRSGADKLEYHVYLALRSPPVPGFTRYDLLRAPEEVRLKLVPKSPNFGEGPATNVMRITPSSLSDALVKFPS